MKAELYPAVGMRCRAGESALLRRLVEIRWVPAGCSAILPGKEKPLDASVRHFFGLFSGRHLRCMPSAVFLSLHPQRSSQALPPTPGLKPGETLPRGELKISLEIYP